MKKMLFFAILIALAMLLPAQALAQGPTNEYGWSPYNPYLSQYNYYAGKFMVNTNMWTACERLYGCAGSPEWSQYMTTTYYNLAWTRTAWSMADQWQEQGFATWPPGISW